MCGLFFSFIADCVVLCFGFTANKLEILFQLFVKATLAEICKRGLSLYLNHFNMLSFRIEIYFQIINLLATCAVLNLMHNKIIQYKIEPVLLFRGKKDANLEESWI